MTKRKFNLGKIRQGMSDAWACEPAQKWLDSVRASSEDHLFSACLQKWHGVQWIGWLCNMLNSCGHSRPREYILSVFSPQATNKLNQMYKRLQGDKSIDWMWYWCNDELSYDTLQSRRKRAMRIMKEVWYSEPVTCPKCGEKSWPSQL